MRHWSLRLSDALRPGWLAHALPSAREAGVHTASLYPARHTCVWVALPAPPLGSTSRALALFTARTSPGIGLSTRLSVTLTCGSVSPGLPLP